MCRGEMEMISWTDRMNNEMLHKVEVGRKEIPTRTKTMEG
jgi:hypothetical protein